MPIPETWMLPPKSYDPTPDLKPTLIRYAKLFDLKKVGDAVGWPFFHKPYDGGGWRGVNRVADEKAAWKAYEDSGTAVMHAQAAVEGFDLFVRCIGFGPQTRCVLYDPSAALHDRYTMKAGFMPAADIQHLRKVTLTINAFFGWEFNSCEALRKKGVWYPIDFANPCPDSQVTSLHFHFPWIVKANIRWSVFCAAVKKPMRQNLDWEPFFEVERRGLPYRERLAAYAAIATARFETDRFEEFCARHLSKLDEAAWEFFGTEMARDAIRKKVSAIYPRHEIESFTEHFWGLI